MEFGNIRYTPGWFAKKFPGFYTEECYHILADYFRDNMLPEKYLEKFLIQDDEEMQNKDDENKGKKTKLEELDETEYGVEETKDATPTELLETLGEDRTVVSGRI